MRGKTRRPLVPGWGYWVMLAVCAAFDVWVGANVDLWVLFMLPIGWAAWNLGRKAGCLLTFLSASWLVVAALEFGSPDSALRFLLLAVLFKATAYAVVVFLVGLLRQQQVERVYVSRSMAK